MSPQLPAPTRRHRHAGLAAFLLLFGCGGAHAAPPAEAPNPAAPGTAPPAEDAPDTRRQGIPQPPGSRGSLLHSGPLGERFGRFDGEITVRGPADPAALIQAVVDHLSQYQYC